MRVPIYKAGLLLCLAASILLTGTTRADWNVGDPFKMTVPQLPDPNGWDINFEFPRVIADDWQCSETGPVSDVHFWFSIRQDGGVPGQQIPQALLQQILGPIEVSYHANVPAQPTNNWQSHPGQPLHPGHVFNPGQYTVRPWGTGQQGWMDPETGEAIPGDHLWIYQVNITNIQNPFVQFVNNIYWLDLSVHPQSGFQVGWKTSMDGFGPRPVPGVFNPFYDDDAVFSIGHNGPYTSLVYPSVDPRAGQSLNMAFVITPEPGTFLAGLSVASLLLFRRRGA